MRTGPSPVTRRLGLALVAGAVALLALVLVAGSADAAHNGTPDCSIVVKGAEGDTSYFRDFTVTVEIVTTGSPQWTNITIDGEGYRPYTGPRNVSGEGAHTAACHVTEHGGAHVVRSRQFIIDTSPPTCSNHYSGAYSPSTGWYVGSGLWSISSSDTRGVWFVNATLDGVTTPYLGSRSVGDGLHTFGCTVVDRAGNTYSASAPFALDTLPPTSCSVQRVYDPNRGLDIQPKNGWYAPGNTVGSGVYVYLAGLDAGSGVARFDVRVNGGLLTSVHNGSFLHLVGDGSRQLTCTTVDAVGHASTHMLSISLDGTRPTCVGAYNGIGGSSGWYRTGSFVLTAQDEGSGLWYLNRTIGGQLHSDSVGPFVTLRTAEITQEGGVTVVCIVTDLAGNTSPTATIQVRLDTLPPTCTLTPSGVAGDNGWFRSAPAVSVATSDNASGVAATTFAVGGDGERAYTQPVTVTAQGETTVACRAVDRAGNSGTSSILLKHDSTPPTLCASLARDDRGNAVLARRAWFAKAVEFDIVTKDAYSGIATAEFRLDGSVVPGAIVRANDASVTLRIDDRGEHVIECAAKDKAGNVADPVRFPANLDDAPPTCEGTILGEGDRGWLRGGASVALAASDTLSGIDAFEYTVDGGARRPYKSAIPLEGDGNHRVECLVRDVAGNDGSRTLDLRLDATPPECSLDDSLDLARVHAAPLAARIAARDATSGVASLGVLVNGAPAPSFAEGTLTLAAPGIHEVECHVEDEAGNTRVVPLGRVRVAGSDPSSTIGPAAVAMRHDAETGTPQPIPGPGVLALIAIAVGVSFARRAR